MPYVDVGKSRLYYETKGSGPALVLAHGVGGNHASWFLQLDELAQHFKVLTFDHRGFGNSSDVENAGRGGFVSDLDAILAHAAVGRAILVGQSMGGGTCLAYACAHPARIAALVLADSLAGMAVPEVARDAMKAAEAATVNLSQVERVLGATTRRLRPFLCTLYEQLASLNSVNIRTLSGAMRSIAPKELAATGIPTLFLVGAEDVLFPPAAVEAFARAAGADFVEVPSVGHSAFYESPVAFNRTLISWLGKVGAGPTAQQGARPFSPDLWRADAVPSWPGLPGGGSGDAKEPCRPALPKPTNLASWASS